MKIDPTQYNHPLWVKYSLIVSSLTWVTSVIFLFVLFMQLGWNTLFLGMSLDATMYTLNNDFFYSMLILLVSNISIMFTLRNDFVRKVMFEMICTSMKNGKYKGEGASSRYYLMVTIIGALTAFVSYFTVPYLFLLFIVYAYLVFSTNQWITDAEKFCKQQGLKND